MNTRKPDAPGPMTVAIADELRAAMAVAKISRPRLASITGISRRSLQRYLNAERTFTVEQLDKMAEALGTTGPAIAAKAQVRRTPPEPPTSEGTKSG